MKCIKKEGKCCKCTLNKNQRLFLAGFICAVVAVTVMGIATQKLINSIKTDMNND